MNKSKKQTQYQKKNPSSNRNYIKKIPIKQEVKKQTEMITEQNLEAKIRAKYPKESNNHSFAVIVSHEDKRVIIVGFPNTSLVSKEFLEIPNEYTLEIYSQLQPIE